VGNPQSNPSLVNATTELLDHKTEHLLQTGDGLLRKEGV
jgi:hypothetical protein